MSEWLKGGEATALAGAPKPQEQPQRNLPPKHYPFPWAFLRSVFPHIPRGSRLSQDAASATIVRYLDPEPIIEGFERIPLDPRFVVVANLYQRKRLWIGYAGAVITRVMRIRFGGSDPAMRWVVTANWPPLRIGSMRVPSPCDVLLPRVAHALWCYNVPFAGPNPGQTERSIRAVVRDAPRGNCPIGLFPEGVTRAAGRIGPPLPGTGRLIDMLARVGYPLLPVRVYETDRLTIRFGCPVPPSTVLAASDPAELAMARVAELAV